MGSGDRIATSLLPASVACKITDYASFTRDVARYRAMSDADLLHATETCLKNLSRVDDEDEADADAALRIVLVPELCERIAPGTRTALRRISSTLAEYAPDDPGRPSFFRHMLSPETRRRLREAAVDLRRRVAATAAIDTRSLVHQVRFAIAGSRVTESWSPSDCVYEPGFMYHVVPAVARRALERSAERRA